MNSKTIAVIAVAAVAAMLVATVAVAPDQVFAHHKKSQKSEQSNNCAFANCANNSAQTQGDGNTVNVQSFQSFL
jgi:hypothetical protein